MDELLSHLNDVLKHVQSILREGMPSIDANAECLPWLNVSKYFAFISAPLKHKYCRFFLVQKICSKLTNLCEILHKFLCEKGQTSKTMVDSVFLCLRQLICCISYLEKILKTEERDKVTLMVCGNQNKRHSERVTRFSIIIVSVAVPRTFH